MQNKIENYISEIDNYISKLIEPETTNLLLEKFEPYDNGKDKADYYKDMQGVYAFFLTEELNFSSVGFCNKEKIESLNKKLINTNEKLKNNKNLIYIGKTHNNNSFDGRVINGYIKGGVTNLTGKIFHYLTGKDRTKYGTEYYHQYKEQIKTWFDKYTEVKFLPLYNKKGEKEKQLKNSDMVISLIEEVLIDVYRPALNKDSKKSKNKK